MKKLSLKKGETYITEGSLDSSIALVQSGRLVAWTLQNGKKYILAEIGRGDVVGELSFFDQKPRSANVTALTDCELVELQLIRPAPDSAEGVPNATFKALSLLMGQLARRLRRANQEIVSLKASLDFLRRHQSSSYADLHWKRHQCLARALWLLQSRTQSSARLPEVDFRELCREISQEANPDDTGLLLETLADVLLEFSIAVIESKDQKVLLDQDRLREMITSLLRLDKNPELRDPPLEASEFLAYLFKNRSSIAASEDDQEFVCDAVFAAATAQQRAELELGLEALHQMGWIVLQSDRSIFRASIPALFQLNHALKFRQAFERGSILTSTTLNN